MTELTDNTDAQSRVAITGGTGFVGTSLARRLIADRHSVLLVARRPRRDLPRAAELATIGLDDPRALRHAIDGCDAVAHLAGINRERGPQTYRRVHVEGTANMLAAARDAGVRRIAMLSFLRARPDCGSVYHESKFEAEKMVRASGIPHTIVKSGVIWGRGDHLVDHITHALFTVPLFATVGWRQPPLRPVAVRDVVRVLRAGLIDPRLENRTVAVVGPQQLTMQEVVRRIASACGRRVRVFPMPVMLHRLLATATESFMHVPLISRAQVRMLDEGLCEPATPCDPLPADLVPTTRFTPDTIQSELPELRPFMTRDLICNRTAEEP